MPKSFIYFLVRYQHLCTVTNSLALLAKFFNDKFQYPIVFFHTKNHPAVSYG